MPYISQESRKHLERNEPKSSGELNYVLSKTALDYLKQQTALRYDQRDFNYEDLNAVIGAFECAKQEFIRMVVNPFEDRKIKENGPLF